MNWIKNCLKAVDEPRWGFKNEAQPNKFLTRFTKNYRCMVILELKAQFALLGNQK